MSRDQLQSLAKFECFVFLVHIHWTDGAWCWSHDTFFIKLTLYQVQNDFVGITVNFIIQELKFFNIAELFLPQFLWWEENLRELRDSIFQKIQALEKSPAPTKNWALWEISPQITHMFVRPIQGASLDPSYIINLVISVCGVSPALVDFVARFMKIVKNYYF